jgi:hypothetical protein
MEKADTDKIVPGGKAGINLENPSSSEAGFKNSGEGQLLFDEDSSPDNAMRSITPPDERDNAYIDNLHNQQQGKQINDKLYVQQTLSRDFFLRRARAKLLRVYSNHG